MNHARTRPRCDHADLTGGGGLASRRRRAPAPAPSHGGYASSAASRSTSFAAGVNDSPAAACRSAWPSSMHAASSPSRSPRSTARSRTSRASSAARSYSSAVRIAAARRSRDVDLQARVAERLGQRGQLGEPLHPVRGTPQHVERLVARIQEPYALLRRRGRRQRELDDAQDLLRARWRRARYGCASTENRTQTTPSPAAFA